MRRLKQEDRLKGMVMKLLVVDNLCLHLKNFDLKNISFEVRKGEHFAIVGPTGSGKSLLLETIAGIYYPDSGKILLEGRDITKAPPEERGIGMVYQDFMLFPHMSVFDNIAYGLRIRGVKNVVDKVNILAEKFSIEHLLNRKPETLSGGEKQKVAIARALAINPPLLLLDEPFSSLDAKTRVELRDSIFEVLKEENVGVVHVTHIAEDAELADVKAEMRGGKLSLVTF